MRGKLYALVDALDPAYGNRIVEINPTTGMVERSLYVGTEPAFLRLTSDEEYAWITFDNIPFVRRINLDSFQVDKNVYLGTTRQYVAQGHGFSTILAYNFTVLPDDDNSLVLGLQQPFNFAFDAVTLYKNDSMQPVYIKNIPQGYYPFCFEPLSRGNYILGHFQSNLNNVFSRMRKVENGIEFVDMNDSTADAIFMRNFFKVHNDTVFNAQGYVLDASDTNGLKVLGKCENQRIGDRHGFAFSQMHNAYIYPNLTDHSLYLTFYDKNTYQARDSVLLFEYPFYQLMMMLELEVIDQTKFAVLIGKDYGDFYINIVDTDPNGTGPMQADQQPEVYPIPSTGKIIVDGSPLHKRICLYDIMGKLLLVNEYDGIKAEMDLGNYQPGLYLLEVIDRNHKDISYTRKIVLQ